MLVSQTRRRDAPATASGAGAAATSETSAVTATAASASATSTTASVTASEATTTVTSTASATGTSASTTTAASGAVQAQEDQALVDQLCAMGYPEDQVRAALRAAFNNADRAVQYLLEGVPEGAGQAPQPTTTTTAPSGGEQPTGDVIAALRRMPQINQLRRLVQQNPSALPQTLQLLGRSNPQLLQWVTNHQQEFLQFMNEPIEEGEEEGGEEGEGEAGEGGIPGMPGAYRQS